MQKIAREMNFSETTFITGYDLKKKKFKVRIFMPSGELPFAGHPTLGTAYIAQKELLKEKVDDLILDMKAGLIPVKFNYVGDEPGILWMKQLNPEFGEKHSVEVFADILGLSVDDFDHDYPIQEVSTGVYFYMVPLKTREALKKIKVDVDKLAEYSKGKKANTPFMFCKEPENPHNHGKARLLGKHEDPATGSANGCFLGYAVMYRYFGDTKVNVRIEQGAEMNRPSLLYLKGEDKGEEISIEVGGKVAYVAKGELL
jgi:trans-2,3-dihydro-3-hydroxyanthranilate isomerase